jgi:hypothetical protein
MLACHGVGDKVKSAVEKHLFLNNQNHTLIIMIIIRGATALTNLGRLSSRRWQSFPTAPDGTGLTCGQHAHHFSPM